MYIYLYIVFYYKSLFPEQFKKNLKYSRRIDHYIHSESIEHDNIVTTV